MGNIVQKSTAWQEPEKVSAIFGYWTNHDLHHCPSSIPDSLILDTGGGRIATITRRAWFVLETHSDQSAISGYQSQSPPKICPIVNAIKKVHLPNRDTPVLFIMNYATLVDDPNEKESLCVPFALMRHGIKVDITPPSLGGTSCGLRVSDQFLPFHFDGEKLYFQISKPTEEDLYTLETFELNSPLPSSHVRRVTKRSIPGNIPLAEWKKRLAFAPDETIHRTFEATTQHYMRLECENRAVPRDHFRSRVPGLRFPRQTERVATDTFFPSIRSYRGNTCSQFFNGLRSNRWEVFPLKTESQTGWLYKTTSARWVFLMSLSRTMLRVKLVPCGLKSHEINASLMKPPNLNIPGRTQLNPKLVP